MTDRAFVHDFGDREAPHEVTRFVLWWYRVMLVGAFGLFAVGLLAMALSSDNIAVKLWVLPWLLLMGFCVWRGARAATIEFRAHEVLISGIFRTRRIELSRLRRVRAGPGTSAALLPWRVPCFELDDGSTVRAEDFRSMRAASIVDEVVAEARRRLGA